MQLQYQVMNQKLSARSRLEAIMKIFGKYVSENEKKKLRKVWIKLNEKH